MAELRWRQENADDAQGRLFGDEGLVHRYVGRGEFRGLEFMHVEARRIINRVPAASGLPFRWTINAYRGCSHACAYCFARPTHEYLGLNSGDDFDRVIVVKVNAVDKLRAELAPARWAGDPIAMGTNTDPYQRAEGKYHLTRGIVEVLAERRNPFSILTKSTLILRDLDLLAEAARHHDVRTSFSIGTLDPEVWRLTEPGTPHPQHRVEAVARLNRAGVPCGVLVGPIIPGLSDAEHQLRTVVTACVDANAASIGSVVLHLRPGVREHWMRWVEANRPDLADAYQRRYRNRAYLPAAERRTITDTVQRLVHEARTARSPP